jgi:hypothetical protein
MLPHPIRKSRPAMYAIPSGFDASGRSARPVRSTPGPWLAALACFFFLTSAARADVTKTDMQVVARALSFVSDPLSGTVRVGIVYAANSPRSVRQAQALRNLLAAGLRIGTVELRPVLIESAGIANADVDLFFLTEYIPADETPALPGDGARRPTLCVTTDIPQVRSGACIMGVRSQPKVEVFVNRAAASASGVTFSTVFRVMITEL